MAGLVRIGAKTALLVVAILLRPATSCADAAVESEGEAPYQERMRAVDAVAALLTIDDRALTKVYLGPESAIDTKAAGLSLSGVTYVWGTDKPCIRHCSKVSPRGGDEGGKPLIMVDVETTASLSTVYHVTVHSRDKEAGCEVSSIATDPSLIRKLESVHPTKAVFAEPLPPDRSGVNDAALAALSLYRLNRRGTSTIWLGDRFEPSGFGHYTERFGCQFVRQRDSGSPMVRFPELRAWWIAGREETKDGVLLLIDIVYRRSESSETDVWVALHRSASGRVSILAVKEGGSMEEDYLQ